MNKEFSYGAIVFRKESDTLLFLLIYSGRNKIWGFPKGHIEQGEDEKIAALREIKEETNLEDLYFIEGFREEDVYNAASNRASHKGNLIEKHSVYFLARTDSKRITIDNDEISDYRWTSLEEAESLLSFDSLRRILRTANNFLLKNTD